MDEKPLCTLYRLQPELRESIFELCIDTASSCPRSPFPVPAILKALRCNSKNKTLYWEALGAWYKLRTFVLCPSKFSAFQQLSENSVGLLTNLSICVTPSPDEDKLQSPYSRILYGKHREIEAQFPIRHSFFLENDNETELPSRKQYTDFLRNTTNCPNLASAINIRRVEFRVFFDAQALMPNFVLLCIKNLERLEKISVLFQEAAVYRESQYLTVQRGEYFRLWLDGRLGVKAQFEGMVEGVERWFWEVGGKGRGLGDSLSKR